MGRDKAALDLLAVSGIGTALLGEDMATAYAAAARAAEKVEAARETIEDIDLLGGVGLFEVDWQLPERRG